jgi:formylglycine-generating enzyme required for sulfatase activity
MGNWPSYFNTFDNEAYRNFRPVEQVSYHQIREYAPSNVAISPSWPETNRVHADSFMGKLRAKTGLTTLDLPTESQWEYACRAGTTTALNSGENLTASVSNWTMSAVGRYSYNGSSGGAGNPGVDTSAGTALVGSYQPNAWGLYDMHVNVMEWCLDWYGTYPGTVTDPRGAVSGSSRVLRGGSWDDNASFCRSAMQYALPPNIRGFVTGFRIARTLP